MRKVELFFSDAYDPVTKSSIDVTSDTVSLTANVKRSIAYWKVPRGAKWRVPAVINDLVLKLKDDSGNELNEQTEITIGFKGPSEREQIYELTTFVYRRYKNLTIQQQQSKDYDTAVVFPSDLPLELKEDDELHILVKSPSDVTLSFANSTIAFSVEEYNYHK